MFSTMVTFKFYLTFDQYDQNVTTHLSNIKNLLSKEVIDEANKSKRLGDHTTNSYDVLEEGGLSQARGNDDADSEDFVWNLHGCCAVCAVLRGFWLI